MQNFLLVFQVLFEIDGFVLGTLYNTDWEMEPCKYCGN